MKLIDYNEVRRKLGGDAGPCRRTIERMVKRGEFVAPIRTASRRVLFVAAEVDAWIGTRRKQKSGARDPMDYDRNDIELYVARPHGYTLDQVMNLDFPPADYSKDDADFWKFETVTAWLGRFHVALHAVAQASNPEGFGRFLEALRGLMAQQGGNNGNV